MQSIVLHLFIGNKVINLNKDQYCFVGESFSVTWQAALSALETSQVKKKKLFWWAIYRRYNIISDNWA